jgi:hypothetical protein
MVFVMEEPPLSKQALARIEAARLEAGGDLLNGLARFWRGVGMSTKALRDHDPSELMPLFERHAERLFDAEAKELLACFPDPEAYSFQLISLPMKVAMRICPTTGIISPENVMATDWTDLYRTLKTAGMKSGRKDLGEALQRLSGDWENYLDHSFSRQFLKGRITSTTPDKQSALKAFRLLFWLKYLFHLRLFANVQRCLNRISTHLSVPLHLWRAEAYRRMGDTEPPPMEAVPGEPPTLPTSPTGRAISAAAPKKRGPKPGHETAARVAEITATLAKDGGWKDKLEEICAAMDKAELPFPKTWPKRDVPMKSWEDGAMIEPALAKKAIAHLLKLDKQRKKAPPETLS